jgi:hypothetical protein
VTVLVLGLGSAPPVRAATTKQLQVVLVTQLTGWEFPPPTETWTGSGVGSDQQVWTFTETIASDHWFVSGTFSMQAGSNGLSGTVVKSPTAPQPGPVTVEPTSWSYTVTGGQGAYAGCSGPGTPLRQEVSPPVPQPSGVVVQEIAFELTCPE